MSKYYCYNPRKLSPMVKHESFEVAKSEAERLCIKEGSQILILKLEGTCTPKAEFEYAETLMKFAPPYMGMDLKAEAETEK